MKSLRSTGTLTARRTRTRSSSEPEKRRSSVSTEMAAAPPASYSTARAAGSAIVGQGPLARAGALDLGDHGHARTAEDRHRVEGRVQPLTSLLESVQADLGLSGREILPDPGDDVV